MKEAFENQILGMFEYMVPLERIENKQTIILEASAPNDKNMNGKLFSCLLLFKIRKKSLLIFRTFIQFHAKCFIRSLYRPLFYGQRS